MLAFLSFIILCITFIQSRNETGGCSNVKLSKSLSWLLRHGAEKEGMHFLSGGFLYVSDILGKPQFKNYTENDIMHVVDTNEKKRFFTKKDEDGRLLIRANQGHSLQVEDLDLTPVTSSDDYPVVVHGTKLSSWNSINTQGLSRMNRNHIHCAPDEPGGNGVISGMRSSCDVLIFLDLDKLLQDNIPVFISANNVILSPGNEHGVIPPSYFKKVINRHTRLSLL